jgi:geranylgeranyl diphosphate/geranylgeranyl-bacteriochlorophyllide a reductase
MRMSTNVLVIGAGPAGATAAKVLSKNGKDVILLEKNFAFVKPCGGGLSINAFYEFGIPENIIQKEVKVIRLVSPAGEKVDIDLKGSGLVIVGRGEFDRELRRQAEGCGAKIIEGEFSGVSRNKHYKVDATAGTDRYEITAEHIIATDGVNSRMRTALGIKPVRAFFTMSEKIQGMSSDCCEFWFGTSHAPLSYSWVFPWTQGISVGTGGYEQGRIRSLFERFKERKGIQMEGEKRVYRIPVWTGDLYNKSKILFAGDSAGQVLPLTYEGIYYAMKAGEFAARAVIENKVDNYKKMWRSRFQKRFMLMNALRDYFLKDDSSAERLVALHGRPEIREASLRLWLMKDGGKSNLMSYIRFLGKLTR